MLIKGIPITLVQKQKTGVDGFNNPIYEETSETVENCLVSPLSEGDNSITTDLAMNGKHGLYQIALPKGDAHKWEGAEIEFFGHRWKVVGFPTEGIENLLPLEWNKKIVVERYG